jgi:hypothetical protein
VPRPKRRSGGGGSAPAARDNGQAFGALGCVFRLRWGRLLGGAIAVAGGREGKAAGRRWCEGGTPVRFIRNGPGEFLRFFAVFSAIFRLGFGSETGEEGTGRRRSPETGSVGGRAAAAAASGGGARRERGGVVIYQTG